MTRIGFIGLGNMGGPMAANLAGAGHRVQVFDLVPESLDRAIKAGCIVAGDAREAVTGCDLAISMLPAGDHVRGLWLSEGGGQDLLGALPTGALVIDCSTIDVASARAVGGAAKARGIRFLDAPVSGGVAGAAAGTLTFIVGGESADFEAARPILACMGQNLFHAGALGAAVTGTLTRAGGQLGGDGYINAAEAAAGLTLTGTVASQAEHDKRVTKLVGRLAVLMVQLDLSAPLSEDSAEYQQGLAALRGGPVDRGFHRRCGASTAQHRRQRGPAAGCAPCHR